MVHRTILPLALFAALTTEAAAATIRVQAGDHVVIVNLSGTTEISSVGGNVLTVEGRASIARSKTDPRSIVVSGDGERVDFTVQVPRAVAIRAKAASGQIFAENIVGNLDVETKSANLDASRVEGNVVVNTGNGNITIDGVNGLVDVTTGNGNTRVRDVQHSVHVVSINGKTEIACVTGAVDVKDTSGRVTVTNASGDVDLFTAMGNATYAGLLHRDHSYRLKTLSGAIAMHYARDAGFSGKVISHAGNVSMDRSLGVVPHKAPRRVDVVSGDGAARIVLDSFDGRIELRAAGAVMDCGGR